MRRTAKTTWVLAGAGFRRYSTYRLAIVAGLTTNSVFGLIRASILLAALASAGTDIAGYSASEASSFVWWSQGLIASVNLFQWNDVAVRVRSGDIAVDFSRPLDPQLAFLAADLGRAALQFLARGLPSILIGALTFGIALPASPWLWPLGVVSTLLAVLVSFGCRYAVNVASFWLVENRGPQIVYMVVSGSSAACTCPCTGSLSGSRRWLGQPPSRRCCSPRSTCSAAGRRWGTRCRCWSPRPDGPWPYWLWASS